MQDWYTNVENYAPIYVTSQDVIKNNREYTGGHHWADPDILTPKLKKEIKKRFSYYGPINFVDGYPRNPVERTYKIGRLLGKYGPNHVVDILMKHKDKIVLIQRKDGSWAMPGGFVEYGETMHHAVLREFSEEVGAISSGEPLIDIEKSIWRVASTRKSKIIFTGYIESPNNTDWSWYECTCYYYQSKHLFDLKPGSDAIDAKWVSLKDLEKYKLLPWHKTLLNQIILI